MIIRSRGKITDIFSFDEFIDFLVSELSVDIDNDYTSELVSDLFDELKNSSVTLSELKKSVKNITKKEQPKIPEVKTEIKKPIETQEVPEKTEQPEKPKFKTKFETILYEAFGESYKNIYSNYITKLKKNIFNIQESFGVRHQVMYLFFFEIDDKVGFVIQDEMKFKYFRTPVKILDVVEGTFVDLFYILHSLLKEYKDHRELIFIDDDVFLEGFSNSMKEHIEKIPTKPLQNISYLNPDKFKNESKISVKGLTPEQEAVESRTICRI